MFVSCTKVAPAFSVLRTTGLICGHTLHLKYETRVSIQIMQKDVVREHNSQESTKSYLLWLHLGQGPLFHLILQVLDWEIGVCRGFWPDFWTDCYSFPQTLSNMGLKGESCHCDMTYFPPTERVLFALILREHSCISSSTWTGRRKPPGHCFLPLLTSAQRYISYKEHTEIVKHLLKLVPEKFVNRKLSIIQNMYFESYKVYRVTGMIKIILELTRIMINIQRCWAFFPLFQPHVSLAFFFLILTFPFLPSTPLSICPLFQVPTGLCYCHLSAS